MKVLRQLFTHIFGGSQAPWLQLHEYFDTDTEQTNVCTLMKAVHPIPTMNTLADFDMVEVQVSSGNSFNFHIIIENQCEPVISDIRSHAHVARHDTERVTNEIR